MLQYNYFLLKFLKNYYGLSVIPNYLIPLCN